MFQLSFSSTHNPSATIVTSPLTTAHHHPPPVPFWLAPLSLCLARLSLPATSPPIVHDDRRIGDGVYARQLRARAAASFSSKISLNKIETLNVGLEFEEADNVVFSVIGRSVMVIMS